MGGRGKPFPHKAGEEGWPVRSAAFQMQVQGIESEWERKEKEKAGNRTSEGFDRRQKNGERQ